jgi:hypothetical protein
LLTYDVDSHLVPALGQGPLVPHQVARCCLRADPLLVMAVNGHRYPSHRFPAQEVECDVATWEARREPHIEPGATPLTLNGRAGQAPQTVSWTKGLGESVAAGFPGATGFQRGGSAVPAAVAPGQEIAGTTVAESALQSVPHRGRPHVGGDMTVSEM